MIESSADRDPFEVVAESFLARFRAGQRPSIEEYAARHPDQADLIRELLPALVMVEQDLTVDRDPAPGGARVLAPPCFIKEWRLGDYRIIREVGRGGMGVVYEAEQLSLGRRVALKVLPGHLAGDGTASERFRREAKAAARLHHTNIVPVFEVGRDGEVAYYAMQFIRGQGLDQIVEELRRLREPDREANGHEPARSEGREWAVTAVGPRRDEPSSPQGRELIRTMGMLLTGRLVAEGSAMPGRGADDESGPAGAERLDPAAPSGPRPDAPSLDVRPAPTAPGPSPSAVLPGGRHVSEVDTSGHRRPYFRSVAQIGRQAAQGLAYAHARGVVHRDIKPSNLLLDTEGVVWITDFGLAKADDDGLTASGDILGTIRYMAPERFRGQSDGRADVYALGLTLYELLTLRPAYEPTDRLKLIERIKNAEPARPRSIDPQIPRDLQTIVLKAIDKHPEHRYPTAEAMSEDLRRFLADEPIKARQISTSEHYWRWARRNPSIALLLGTLTGVLILATVGSLLAAGRLSALAGKERKAAFAERSARLEADIARKAAESASALAQQAEEEMRKFAAEAKAGKLVAERETRRAEGEKKRAEEQLGRSEGLVYAGKLMLAQNDFESGNGGLALHYLDECQANLRGWEFRHLWGRINARQTLRGNQGAVSSAAFSPDGRRIVTGSTDGTARVWDAATAEPVLTLKGHQGIVWSVAFSPDGKRLVTAGGKYVAGKTPGQAKVWDVSTGRELLGLDGHSYAVWCVAFSPDGRRIVTGAGDRMYGPGEAKIWDSATGRELPSLIGYTDSTRSVAYSPDGRRIVTGATTGVARSWEAETGRELLTFRSAGKFYSIAFSPDGGQVATGHDGGMARVWDASTGRELLAIKAHGQWVNSVAFSPDGSRIVTGSADQTTKLWDATTGLELFTLKGHSDKVRSVAFSPDGRRILTGSEDGTAKVWDATTGQEVPILRGHTDFVSGIAFSPDSRRIVTSSGDGTARVWDAATARPLLILERSGLISRKPEHRLNDAAFSPDGRRIVTGGEDRTARVWDAATGQELLRLEHSNPLSSVAFSPDGRRIATGTFSKGEGGSGELKVWDAATGRELPKLKRQGPGFHGVKFSPDGSRILAGSQDGTARVWDSATGREFLALTGHTRRVTSVAFSPDGQRILTGSDDCTARVWDAETGQELLSLRGHTKFVTSVAFSPEGDRIVTGSHDRSAKVWDAGTGQELLAFQGQPQEVLSVAFSPDGERIVTGIAGANATASVWHAARHRVILVLKGQGEILASVAFSPDGKRIFGWDCRKQILAWSATDGRPIDPSDPPVMPPPGPARSPDGFLCAKPEGKAIFVTDKRPSPEENAWPLPVEAERKRHQAELARSLRSEEIEEARRLVNDGVEAFEQGDFADANDRLRRASGRLEPSRGGLRDDPSLARLHGICHVFLASTLRDLNRPADALAHAREALSAYESIRDANPPDFFNMARSHALLSSLDGRAAPGDRDKLESRAVEYLRMAVAGDKARILPQVATDRDLDPLRRRADFGGVIADAAFPSDPLTHPSPFASPLATPGERKIRGEALIADGRTLEAIPYLESAWEGNPEDSHLLIKVAALRAWFHQDAELAAACRNGREYANGTKIPGVADAAAKSSCLRPPDEPVDHAATLALARSAYELGKDEPIADWFRMVLGIAEYRAGHDEAATETLRGLIGNRYHISVTSGFYLAMSLSRQGKDDDARRVATEAISRMRPLPRDEANPLAGGVDHDDLILWLAYKEARALIGWTSGPRQAPR